VIGRNLDQDDPDAVGVLDPHLDQALGLCYRFLDHRDSGRGRPGMLSVNIPDLDPDHHRALRARLALGWLGILQVDQG
jgi:hypothetical protein